jgi:F-type H+-transporting ATPase subunit alpha
VSEQISVLMALTARLFDPVPLDRMVAAEQAVRQAAADIPDEVSARFDSAAKMSDEDRATIVEIGRTALEGLRSEADPKSAPDQIAETTAKPQPDVVTDES